MHRSSALLAGSALFALSGCVPSPPKPLSAANPNDAVLVTASANLGGAPPSNHETTAGAGTAVPSEVGTRERAARLEKDWRPSELLTTKDIAFALEEDQSELEESAEWACAALKPKPEAFTTCVTRERDAFKAHVLQFTMDPAGRLVLIAYERRGNVLTDVFQSFVEFTEEAAEAVTVKLVDQPKGRQPFFKGERELRLQFPNRYGFFLEEPRYGRITYKSKVGLAPRP
ncbi:MAG: hypothetical protein JW751_29395 [Polyangiaceae bacterium]|nr:hypothetical protein [Polyangiaceae bacterium]